MRLISISYLNQYARTINGIIIKTGNEIPAILSKSLEPRVHHKPGASHFGLATSGVWLPHMASGYRIGQPSSEPVPLTTWPIGENWADPFPCGVCFHIH